MDKYNSGLVCADKNPLLIAARYFFAEYEAKVIFNIFSGKRLASRYVIPRLRREAPSRSIYLGLLLLFPAKNIPPNIDELLDSAIGANWRLLISADLHQARAAEILKFALYESVIRHGLHLAQEQIDHAAKRPPV